MFYCPRDVRNHMSSCIVQYDSSNLSGLFVLFLLQYTRHCHCVMFIFCHQLVTFHLFSSCHFIFQSYPSSRLCSLWFIVTVGYRIMFSMLDLSSHSYFWHLFVGNKIVIKCLLIYLFVITFSTVCTIFWPVYSFQCRIGCLVTVYRDQCRKSLTIVSTVFFVYCHILVLTHLQAYYYSMQQKVFC